MGRLSQISSILPAVPAVIRPPAKTADPFYTTPRWRRFVGMIKAERGNRCQDCRTWGSRDVKIHGDHIVERQDNGAEFDRRNVRLRCTGCHNKKTAASAAARA